MIARTYTSNEVAGLTGTSLRQLQWWDETSIVSPVVEGHSRAYAEDDAVLVGVVSELRRKRLSLQKIRRVVRFLQKHIAARGGLSEEYLITDGRRVTMESDLRRVIHHLKSATAPTCLVSMGDQLYRLRRAA